MLSVVKTVLQSYCDSKSGVNQMWTLKNSKKICSSPYSQGPSPHAISLNFSILYISIPPIKTKQDYFDWLNYCV